MLMLNPYQPVTVMSSSESSAMAKQGVKLFSMWASPFGLRVEWALRLKGVDYLYINEDLHNKSPELLRFNPVTKKIPVLVHGGRPIAESLVIIEYIDEAWSDGARRPIFPQDPFDRAQARFWAKFADDRILPATFSVYSGTGEELRKAVEELQEALKTLEGALGGKKFFGGEEIGYLDIAVGWLAYWIPMIEELAGVTVVSRENFQAIHEWFERFLEEEAVKEKLPPKEKMYALNRARREQLISGEVS
ncbi:Glutathione transferase GST 23 [Apostasia shenzhenica]|uniref:glutathione transferase n=1 Tax=Apostasia shenzhenica TaxID=1088818 RepID=A0A2I0BAH4_9ASPA|nr:Glutathione transferase GST 23 [Apostasia shenzhenica]